MSLAAARYYRNSGAVPFGGMVRMLLLGGTAAAVLSLVYSLAVYYIPFIKLHCLLTLCFGLLMGFVVQQCAYAGKIRNRLYCSLVGLVIGGLTVYLAWVWFLWILSEYTVFIFDPSHILAAIHWFGENGLWEMNGQMVGKWALYGAWIAEAAAILIATTLMAAGNDKPFCEYCQAWTTAADDVAVFPLTDHAELRLALEDERYDTFDRLRAAGPLDPNDCLHASLLECPCCAETTYLTVAQVTTTPGSEGPKVNRTEIVKHLAIPRDVADRLLARGQEPAPAEVPLPADAALPSSPA